MLTVKLRNDTTGRTKIIECASVEVEVGSDCTIVYAAAENGVIQSYWVVKSKGETDKRMSGMDVPAYHVAFVENAAGATTQIVRA